MAALAVACASCVMACGRQVAGNPVTAPPASVPTTTKTTTAPTTLTVNLCGLLHWSDLGYPDTRPDSDGPSNSGSQPGWSQFCQWTSYQGNAGYTAPPEPTCASQENSGSVGGSFQSMAAAASQLNSIVGNSNWVIVAVGWRPGPVDGEVTSTYTQAGHVVSLDDRPANWTCIADLAWAHGHLEVEVVDATKAFGTPCDQAKRLVGLLIQREPH